MRSVCCFYSNTFLVIYFIFISSIVKTVLFPLHNNVVGAVTSNEKDITVIQYQDTIIHEQQQQQITITSSSSSSIPLSPTVKSIVEVITKDPRTTVFGQLVATDPLFNTFRHYLTEFKNISILVPWNEALVSHTAIQQVLNNNLYFLLDNTQHINDNILLYHDEEDVQLQIKTTLLNHTKIKLRIKGSALSEEGEIIHKKEDQADCVNVIGEPIIINHGGVYVYIIDQVPSVPKDVIQTLQELHQNMAYELFQNLSFLLPFYSDPNYPSSSNIYHDYSEQENKEQQLHGQQEEGKRQEKIQQVTIFAPINSAFGTVQPNLLSDSIRDQLASWHIISGIYTSEQWRNNETIEMKNINGQSLEIRNGQLWLDPKPIPILTSDILLANGGILHLIDQVVWMKQQQQEPYVGGENQGKSSNTTNNHNAAQTRLTLIAVLLHLIGLTLFGIPVL